jgi:CheY-like chemotaxis protein
LPPQHGDVAQLVEQRTENPCVTGSIPVITTIRFQMSTSKYLRVLLIDDNEIDNFINERMITTSGFSSQVIVKNSCDAAIDYLREHQDDLTSLPEVIFLDLNMPGKDGFAFLADFEKLSETAKGRCRIVVLSSSISPEDINKASTNPYVYKYVNKPLSEKYLAAIEI